MLLGAAYAGIAIENSMLGFAHSCANPLTAEFGIVHGQAVGMMLPHVVRFNAEDAVSANGYQELAIHAGIVTSGVLASNAVQALAQRIEQCLAAAGFPEGLAGCGVTPEAVSKLAEGAVKQWTAQFNPRQATVEDFAMLYSNAL
jgi:alcohol dehydrogenase